jgi:acid phosphatase
MGFADHFFQGAFGGSFLNHQYLVCACAPLYPSSAIATNNPTVTVLNTDANGNFTSTLAQNPGSAVSAMTAKPIFTLSGNLTPLNYFGDGHYYAVNTMQPPFQPSGNAPASSATGNQILYANSTAATTLPAQTAQTIADLMDAQNVSWKWYSGSWKNAVTDGTQTPMATRNVIYATNTSGIADSTHVDFQAHHQPLNYFDNFDPVNHTSYRSSHLKDYTDLVNDASNGTLPAVAYYKPEGYQNQHPGYTNITNADNQIANLVKQLQASPQWKNMVIVITYDENGGQWDHVAPPTGDKLGPGTRIPALIISPFAKKGTVDHTPYDTGSIARLISRVFNLPTLPGIAARDAALKAHGEPAMGDLSQALAF